eukprot:2829954-Amphidinium_carterae.2
MCFDKVTALHSQHGRLIMIHVKLVTGAPVPSGVASAGITTLHELPNGDARCLEQLQHIPSL